jgi:hypothetical protein
VTDSIDSISDAVLLVRDSSLLPATVEYAEPPEEDCSISELPRAVKFVPMEVAMFVQREQRLGSDNGGKAGTWHTSEA